MLLLTPTHLEPNLAIHILYPILSVSFPYLPPLQNNLQVGMRVVDLEHERWQIQRVSGRRGVPSLGERMA